MSLPSKAEDLIKSLFPQLPEEIIKQCLTACSNDVERTVQMLMELSGMQEDEEDDEDNEEAQKQKLIQNTKQSVLSPHEEYASTCGYCKSDKKGSVATGVDALSLTVADYQDLVDRGWRRYILVLYEKLTYRSGTWLYKPTMSKTCCPAYTIRLDVEKYTQSKSHKKVLKRIDKYLQTGEIPKEVPEFEEEKESMQVQPTETPKQAHRESTLSQDDPTIHNLKRIILQSIEMCVKSGLLSATFIESCHPLDALVQIKPTHEKQKHLGDTCSNVAIVLSGKLRKQNKGATPVTPTRIAEQIVTHLPSNIKANVSDNGFINFKAGISMKKQKIKQFPKVETTSHTENPVHRLDVTTVRSVFDQEEFELYCKYQKTIHKDKDEKLTPKSYTRFLVTTPLKYEAAPGLGTGYGSFHQLYRLDGKLIAVGVVDILPKCLSSVYLFYDPDYSFMSLGIYSALKEIEWTQQASKTAKELHYYYMGFYIHSCPKMRYKGQYKPSDLLDPVAYVWCPLSDCVPKLDKTPYTRFVTESSAPPSEDEQRKIAQNIPLLIGDKRLRYSDLTHRGKEIVGPRLLTLVQTMGVPVSSRIVAHFR